MFGKQFPYMSLGSLLICILFFMFSTEHADSKHYQKPEWLVKLEELQKLEQGEFSFQILTTPFIDK